MSLKFAAVIGFAALSITACSSQQYKQQEYANLQTSKVMEYDYSVVWKGIKDALSEYRLQEANEEEGKAVTQWVHSTSNQKYIEVKVNQAPRRKYLQTRYKYTITAKPQMIGVLVEVKLKEEVERVNDRGEFQGWTDADKPDTGRANEMLQLIERKILSGRHV